MERVTFFTKLSDEKVDGLPAYEGTAQVDGMDIPISMASAIVHIRADEAYIEMAQATQAHQLAILSVARREAEALERIAASLEKPALIGGRE